MRKALPGIALIALMMLCLAGCHGGRNDEKARGAIVGAWIVKIPDAPFPLHMFVFHSDGTVEQSNPEAGNPNTSDSNLMGSWWTVGDEYRGKVVEITADRATHRLAGRGEVSFELKVRGNTFDGTASATLFDASGRPLARQTQVRMEGERVQR